MTTSDRRRTQRQVDRMAAREADLRAEFRSGDPGAGKLADYYRARREGLELALSHQAARLPSLPLFD